MKSCDVSDRESEESCQGHRTPEVEAEQLGVVDDDAGLSEGHHEGYEENDGVEVVVECQEPDAVVHFGQNSLDVDGVQGHEEGGKNSVDGSGYG